MTSLLIFIVCVAVLAVGAFPGTTATLVDAIANSVIEWIAAAAAGLQESMARHDPVTSDPRPSRARRLIGACVMTALLVPLLPAEGYLIFLGVTGLLGLDFEETTLAVAGTQHTAAGDGLWDWVTTLDSAMLIKLAVAGAIMSSVIVAVMWAYDERYLERPQSPAIRRSLDWTGRIAKGAALTTMLVAALHRATASLDVSAPAAPASVSDAAVMDADSLRIVDKYLTEDSPVVAQGAASGVVLAPWVRPTLTVVGTIASATAPTAASVIAFLYGPIALAGQIWGLILLVSAALLIVVSRIVATAVEATRSLLRLAIETCSALVFPVISWCRLRYERELVARAGNRPFSPWQLAMCSWVLLVETERLARLREASPGGEGEVVGAGATRRFSGSGIGRTKHDRSMKSDSTAFPAEDLQHETESDNSDTLLTSAASGGRVYDVYGGSPASTDPISRGAPNE